MKHLHVFLGLVLLAGIVGSCSDAFDADDTVTINGTVTEQASGAPVAGAAVSIVSPQAFQRTRTTDSTGTYRFTLDTEDDVSVDVSVTKNAFAAMNRTVSGSPGDDLTNINFALVAADTTDSGNGTDGENGNENAPGAAGITLANTPVQAINIAQTGESISAPFSFQVVDSSGQSLSGSRAVQVQFRILSGPGGDERLVPEEVTTNDQGTATTTLYSGNKAGELRVQARIDADELGYTMQSAPVTIAIHGGFPSAGGFSISSEVKNTEAFTINSVRVPITVLLGDEFSNPVKPGTIVYFETSGGIIQGSARTNDDGEATVDLISGDPRPQNGVATVTASTVNKNDQRIQRQVDVIFSSSKARIDSETAALELEPQQSATVDFLVTDQNGNPMAPGTQITATGGTALALQGDTDITLTDSRAPAEGVTAFTLTATNATTDTADIDDALLIEVTSPSGQTITSRISALLLGTDAPPPPAAPASIELSTPPAEAINIAATGTNTSTAMRFQVRDANGQPLSGAAPTNVSFRLTSNPGGNARLTPTSATTDDDGQASTRLISGNTAGVAQIIATVQTEAGQTYRSEPIVVGINGGFPDADFFNIDATPASIDNSLRDGLPTVSVSLGDQFSNPVKPGTAVSFETTGGIIQGSATTDDDGQASVSFTDLRPLPPGGIATVTARTIGTGNQSLEKTTRIVFSTPTAAISASPTDFSLNSGGRQRISYTVADQNGNRMAAGTQVNVIGSEGVQLAGDTNVTLTEDHSRQDLAFTVTDGGTSQAESIDLQIQVTSPSGKTTTFNNFNARRIIEGNEQVGPAAIVLAEQPPASINNVETGDDVSAPLNFQVRDSLGRPLTADNAVEVEFELASSPGGGEDLVPERATTDAQGNVTTTLFSGNKAGEVQVRAIIRRPEQGFQVRSSPVLIAIHGGFPDFAKFSLSAASNNYEGFTIDNTRNTITVVLGDQFSNPVKPGTVVSFETSGGIIQGSGRTDDDGIVTVDLISGNPRPTGGVANITASTVNANSQRIRKSIPVVMSTSTADISAMPTSFDLQPGGGADFSYIVVDANGNPMAEGTTISINGGDGIELTGDTDITLGDYLEGGPGRTQFNFSIRDVDVESNAEASLTLQITVTTPSGNTTTYSQIRGTRR